MALARRPAVPAVHGMWRAASYVPDPSLKFEYKEKEEVKKWVAEEQWHVDGEDTDAVSALAQEYQDFVKQHGMDPTSVALRDLAKTPGALKPGASVELDEHSKGVMAAGEKLLARLNEAGDDVSEELQEELQRFTDMLMKETQALDAGLRELLVAPGDGDDASVPPEVQAALDKLMRAGETDFIIEPEDEVLSSKSSPVDVEYAERMLEDTVFDAPIKEVERPESLLGMETPSEVEKTLRTFNQHIERFSSIKLDKKVEDNLEGEVAELARLLSQNPSFSKADVEEAVEFFEKVVTKKIAVDHDYKQDVPSLNYKEVQPWTYDRGLDFPGTALADRLDDKGRYLDAPSSTAQQYADLYSSAVEALGPAAMKHLKEVLARVDNPNALGKQ